MSPYYYYDSADRVLAEYEKPDGGSEKFARSFVYGNGIDEVLAMFLPEKSYDPDDVTTLMDFCSTWLADSGDGNYDSYYDFDNSGIVDMNDFAVLADDSWSLPQVNETRFYYLHDVLGSVVGLVGARFKRESDREFYLYDVYGASSDVSEVGNPYLFTGRRLDILDGGSLKIYHYRARAYDPQTGRFLQTDPIGYADSMNLYEYVTGNPTNWVDPWGLRLRAKDKELVMVMTNTGVFMGIPIEESRAVPDWTWSDGVSYTMTWRDAGTLWFNNEVTFDKFNYQKYEAVKQHLLTKLKNANTVKDVQAWVTAFEIGCNIVPFFDASYKLVEEGDPKGALVSAGIESALYVVAWAGGKAIKCFSSCGDDVARVTDDIARGADDLSKGLDNAVDLAKQGKKVPNPHGRLGSPAHQAKVQEVYDDIYKRGLRPQKEVQIGTINGQKGSRYMDVVARDRKTGRILEAHQVGKTLKTRPRVPIARERAAFRDVRYSPELRGARRMYHTY